MFKIAHIADLLRSARAVTRRSESERFERRLLSQQLLIDPAAIANCTDFGMGFQLAQQLLDGGFDKFSDRERRACCWN